MCRLSSLISGLIEWACIRPQSPPRFIRQLNWLRGRGRVGALHREKARLGARRSENWLGAAERHWRRLWPWSLEEVRWSRRGSCAIWLRVSEVVGRLHEEAVGGLLGYRPWNGTSRCGGRWCCRAGMGCHFILCQSASFRAIDVAICLPITGKTEWVWPIHIDSHCEVCGRREVVGDRRVNERSRNVLDSGCEAFLKNFPTRMGYQLSYPDSVRSDVGDSSCGAWMWKVQRVRVESFVQVKRLWRHQWFVIVQDNDDVTRLMVTAREGMMRSMPSKSMVKM